MQARVDGCAPGEPSNGCDSHLGAFPLTGSEGGIPLLIGGIPKNLCITIYVTVRSAPVLRYFFPRSGQKKALHSMGLVRLSLCFALLRSV